MIIETKRLIIRPFKASDYKRVAEVCGDYDVAKMTLAIPHPYTEENAKGFIEYTLESSKKKESYEYAVCFKEDRDTVVGCMGLMHVNKTASKAELGYWIDKAHWNQGVATEAATAMIRFAFDYLKLHSVIARHAAHNPASGKVMKKCGMKYVGLFREHECRDGKFYDVEYYEILASDLNIKSK